MKIICTKDEKAELIYELATFSCGDPGCLFMSTHGGCVGKVNCKRCIEDQITWEIRADGWQEMRKMLKIV